MLDKLDIRSAEPGLTSIGAHCPRYTATLLSTGPIYVNTYPRYELLLFPVYDFIRTRVSYAVNEIQNIHKNEGHFREGFNKKNIFLMEFSITG